MRNKNSIIMRTHGGAMFSGSGLQRNAIRHNLRHSMSHIKKVETVVNSPVFGLVIGSKKDNDHVKVGNIGGTGYPGTSASEPVDDIGTKLKKIEFKEKRKKNAISFQI